MFIELNHKANEFEKNLREQQLCPDQKKDFDKILLTISQFLKTI